MESRLRNLDFDSLRQESAAPSSCTTFAYWVGILTDIDSRIATDADEACAAMSHQYDVEEQGNLCGFPEYVPAVFRPIAPVTLAKEWSPLPLALQLLGEPVRISSAEYGKRSLIFRPSLPLASAESGADIAHFLFLLKHVVKSSTDGDHIMVCGCPGWSYRNLDPMFRGVKKQMREFGFVFQDRKPKRGVLSCLFNVLRAK